MAHPYHHHQSFLGFNGYYCQFIPKFSQTAWPLHKLTSPENVSKKKASIICDDKCLWSFDELKYMCTTSPILAYADFTKPFKLHTDACGSDLVALLYQIHDDQNDTVISYTIRSLATAEMHYPAHKLEFLTLRWDMVKKFHEYPYVSIFDINTDNLLMYILTIAKLDALSHQSVTGLVNYNFWFYYRAWKANVDAVALLKVSWPTCVTNDMGIYHWLTTTAAWAMQEATLESLLSPIEAYNCALHVLDPVENCWHVSCVTTEDWWQTQLATPILREVIVKIQNETLH